MKSAWRRVVYDPPTVAFGAVALGVVALRALILLDQPGPSGIDGGNWLAFGHALIGNRVRSSEIVYPPLVPVLTLLATTLLGPTAGLNLLASVASIAPASGVFAALRYAGGGWTAVLASGPLLASTSVGEAAAWGGYPQLFALGLMIAFIAAVDRVMRWPDTAAVIVAGVLLFLALAASHLFAAMVVAGGAITVVLHVLFIRDPAYRSHHVRSVKRLAAASAPCVLLAPLYLHLARTVLDTFSSRPVGDRIGGRSLVSAAEFVYRDFPLYWRGAAVLAVLAPVLLWPRRMTRSWMVTTTSVMSAVFVLAAFREARFAYALPVVASLGVGAWLRDVSASASHNVVARGVAVAACVIAATAVVWNVPAGLRMFEGQRDFYRVVTPDVLAALAWLERESDPNTTVAVNSVLDSPAGWWVEGVARRPTFTASDLKWLNFEDERRRARVANGIFVDLYPTAATLDRARDAGADLVFMFKKSERFRAWMLDGLRRTHPDAVVYENEDAAIVATRPER